jgi:mRNA-degrading endonuclease RelE of RelBE toxin-antitoxin system
MPFKIEFTQEAKRHLDALAARDRAILLDAIEEQLTYEPTVATRNRKPLRSSALADWELRVGQYRVFYTVKEERVLVLIIAIGVKEHNRLFIEGKEFKL